MDIPAIARHRAHCAARYEAIASEKTSRDPEERAAQYEGYKAALAAYQAAEEQFARATATYTAQELAEILQVGKERAA